MTSIRKTLGALAVLAIVGGFAAQAEALPIVSVVPNQQVVNVDDVFNVDVVVNNDGTALGGWEFVLSFSNILNLESYSIDPGSNLENEIDFSGFGGANGASPFLTFIFGDPVQGQPAAFTLASFQFKALAPGVSPLDLSAVVLSEFDGEAAIFPLVNDGQVCVETPCPTVPEPTLLVLLTTGVATAIVRRRARRS